MFHYQNLNDSKKPKIGGILRHGRAWWGRFHWEWSILWGWRLGLNIGGQHFSIRTPLATLYFTFNQDDEREAKEFELSFHDGAIWLRPWSNPWGSIPYCFHVDDFISGKRKHTLVEGEKLDILIPMPEGCYKATMTKETRTWKRSRWFAFTREMSDIKIPGGIPFQGKGENSYDCGDDGLYGIHSEGHDIPTAISTVVKSVLESRKRYGKTINVQNAEKNIIPLNMAEYEHSPKD